MKNTLIVYLLLSLVITISCTVVCYIFWRQIKPFIKACLILLTSLMLIVIVSLSFYLSKIISFKINPESTIMVLHASGLVKNETGEYYYTNTIDNFDECYEKGFRYFEYDFILSSDKKIIGAHDYRYLNGYDETNPISYEEYINTKILGNLTGVTISNLVEKLKQYEDAYIIFDSKTTLESDYSNFFKEFVKELTEINALDLLNRFIPQLYSYEMYLYMCENFNFNSYIYTNYMSNYSANEIVELFFGKDKIKFITIWSSYSKEFCKVLTDNNFKVLMHTVNDKNEMKELSIFKKAFGFYTDNIYIFC